MTGAPVACLDDNAINAYLTGALAPEQLDAAREHVIACSACRALVTLLVAPGSGLPAAAAGARIDRYVVLDHLGAGGMGTVFTAHDTELKRTVALKLVHPLASLSPDSGVARARLLHEAQAMAQLNHPNVVAVYDAGTSGSQLFIAMERVNGTTLARWQVGRPWREVLTAYVAAGRGLAAAHAVGITHRDFKPSNVLVGDDGRVRVTDFGLAAVAGALPTPAHDAPVAPAAPGLTPRGAVLGTPEYMAPEQRAGSATDARSDQFSFCVALWEALHGAPPSQPPARTRTPAGLRRALQRGMAQDPALRFDSLAALLAVLEGCLRRRRAVWASVGVTTAAVLLAGAAFVAREEPCQASSQHLAGVWDDARRVEVERALSGSSLPYGASAWATVKAALDDYALAWGRARTEACLATHVHKEQSPELLDARMVCLDRRRLELRALVEELSHPRAPTIENAARAAQALISVEACSALNVFSAGHPPAPGTAERAAWDEALLALAQTKATKDSGQYREGLERARRAAALARGLPKAGALHAEALLLIGQLHNALSEFKEAEQQLQAALPLAEAAGADETAANAWLQLSYSVGAQQGQFEEGHRFVEHSRAFVERAGSAPRLLATWHSLAGSLAFEEARFAEAVDHQSTALALRMQLWGERHYDTAMSHELLGNALLESGKADEALGHYQRALATREQLLGKSHPLVGDTLTNIGAVLYDQGDLDGVISYGQRSREVLEAALGPDAPVLGFPLSLIADAYLVRGDCASALPLYRRSLALLERSNGPDSVQLVLQLVGIGTCQAKLEPQRGDEARTFLERAVKIVSSSEGAPAEERGAAYFALARSVVELPAGRTRALELAAKAESAFAEIPSKLEARRQEVAAWRSSQSR